MALPKERMQKLLDELRNQARNIDLVLSTQEMSRAEAMLSADIEPVDILATIARDRSREVDKARKSVARARAEIDSGTPFSTEHSARVSKSFAEAATALSVRLERFEKALQERPSLVQARVEFVDSDAVSKSLVLARHEGRWALYVYSSQSGPVQPLTRAPASTKAAAVMALPQLMEQLDVEQAKQLSSIHDASRVLDLLMAREGM
jgi:hypothetical protein